MRSGRLTSTLIALVLTGSAVAATPIGVIESDGEYAIRAADSDRAVRFRQSGNTLYSGETVIARQGVTVVNLKSGGGLGFTDGSEVTVTLSDDGQLLARINDGELLYALPESKQAFEIQAGNFAVRSESPEPESIQVARGEGQVGTVRLREDGNIEATVRSGSLFITNGSAVRYRVDAGESVGLLDLPGSTIRTQGVVQSSAPLPPILIQSPEQVGTLEDFLVRWEAFDPVDGDYIVIAKEGADPDEFESVVSSDEGNVLEFQAPGTAGDYEIRFIDGQTGEIKRFVYLDVVGNVVPVAWWPNAVIGIAAGATSVYIGTEIADDDDGFQRSVSP